MSEPRIERVSLDAFTPDPRNPRARSDRAKATLAQSLRDFGPARSVVVDGRGRVVAGNGTVEAARAIGITDALVIDAPDDAIVVVRKGGFSPAQSRAYSVADNQTTDLSTFDDDDLLAALDELTELDFPLTATGFSSEELDVLLAEAEEGVAAETEADDEPPADLFRPWESDNEWGVPTLDLTQQGSAADLDGDVLKWGTRRRGEAGPRLVHFYTDDYRFWNLNRNPQAVLRTGCWAAVEPNYSTWPAMARAEALWWIYSKRLVARWWQSQGLRVFVDSNVDPAFADLALLGVPPGWRSYATRWQKNSTEAVLAAAYSAAVERRGSEDVLLVVVGGGDKVGRLCAERGWTHLNEEADVARGRKSSKGA